MTGPVGPGHRLLGRYEIVRLLGAGSGGTVWEAHDHTLGRAVALKQVTFPSSTPDQQREADQKRARTQREARLAATLRSPHVVAIHDQQEIDGDLWLVLEHVPSRSLADALDATPSLSPREAAGIGAAVADALAVAHEKGITHRDVKPGNVLLGTEPGVVKLTDFGIAHSETERELTGTGVVTGTPAYMAPEQARGEACTPESDVFSLGATVYRAVEGSPPFGSDDSYIQLMHRVAYEPVRPPTRAGALGPLLMQLLEANPATRPDARTAAVLLRRHAGRATETTDPSPTRTDPDAGPDADPDPDATVGVGAATVPGAGAPAGATVPPRTPPPRTPPSGSPSGSPSGTAPPRRPWWRRPSVLVAAAVLVALLIVGSVLAATGAWRSDPDAAFALPDEVPAIALTGDPTAADPCRLRDATAMSRFGTTRLGPGDNTGECRVTVRDPRGRVAYVDAHYSNAGTETITPAGSTRMLGRLSIVPAGMVGPSCTTYLKLADDTTVGIGTRNGSTTTPAPDLCGLTDAAAAVATNQLADEGITYTPGWQGGVSLAGKNACQITGDTSVTVPALVGLRRYGYPNGSNCFLGIPRSDALYAFVGLGLAPQGTLNSTYGTFAALDGKATYTRSMRGYHSPVACRVVVVHRQSFDVGVTGPTEFVTGQLEGPLPFQDLCTQARGLAEQVERNAG